MLLTFGCCVSCISGSPLGMLSELVKQQHPEIQYVDLEKLKTVNRPIKQPYV